MIFVKIAAPINWALRSYVSFAQVRDVLILAKISENVTTLHHGLAYNEHKNIISVY